MKYTSEVRKLDAIVAYVRKESAVTQLQEQGDENGYEGDAVKSEN